MDVPMKSMKIDREDKEKKETESLVSAMPVYPYGLTLYIEPEVYKKLALSKAPQLGQVLGLHATVEVSQVSMEDSVTGAKNISMRLQITDMTLLEKEEKRNPDKVLYNKEG